MKITKEFRTETAHRLQNHPGRCANIHGHSYIWHVSLETDQMNLMGMIEDFSDLKKTAGAIIDEFDHSVILEENDPMLPFFGGIKQRLIIMGEAPTAENMAFHVARRIQPFYPHCVITVKIWETATSSAEYSTGGK